MINMFYNPPNLHRETSRDDVPSQQLDISLKISSAKKYPREGYRKPEDNDSFTINKNLQIFDDSVQICK